MAHFDDLTKRLIDRIDELEKWIKDLCERQTETDKKIDEHLKVEAALDQYKKEIRNTNNKKFYVVLGLFGTGFSILQLTLTHGWWF